MSELVGARPPGWFRLLSILAPVWNLIGVAMYLQERSPRADRDRLPALITMNAILLVWLARTASNWSWLR